MINMNIRVVRVKYTTLQKLDQIDEKAIEQILSFFKFLNRFFKKK